MDFELTPEAVALRDLANEILADHATPEHLGGLQDSGAWFDRAAWTQLARAGVLGSTLPESAGGAGLGFLELYQVLEQVGLSGAQVPYWEVMVLGADTVARHGSEKQRERLLGAVASGDLLLTAALLEPGAQDRRRPATRATSDDSGWVLTGVKTQVPLGVDAGTVLVTATDELGRAGVFIVEAQAPGVTWEVQSSVSTRPVSSLTLDAAPAELVGTMGNGVVDDVVLRAEAALTAMQAGVCSRALALTASYTSGREQFGQPLATFQAVRQRLADSYIDVEAIRLTSIQAAWLLSIEPDDLGEAERAVSIAKYWAGEAGHRVLHAAHHLHGGMGIDLDYELHRFFRTGKHIEMTLGTSRDHLLRLGRALHASYSGHASGGEGAR